MVYIEIFQCYEAVKSFNKKQKIFVICWTCILMVIKIDRILRKNEISYVTVIFEHKWCFNILFYVKVTLVYSSIKAFQCEKRYKTFETKNVPYDFY